MFEAGSLACGKLARARWNDEISRLTIQAAAKSSNGFIVGRAIQGVGGTGDTTVVVAARFSHSLLSLGKYKPLQASLGLPLALQVSPDPFLRVCLRK